MILSLLLSPSVLVLVLVLIPVVFWVWPYLKRWDLHDIPSPFPASFTNLWLLYQCRRGRRFRAVDDLHKKHGSLVRIQPHHVSVADVDAINPIYGHGNGFLKS